VELLIQSFYSTPSINMFEELRIHVRTALMHMFSLALFVLSIWQRAFRMFRLRLEARTYFLLVFASGMKMVNLADRLLRALGIKLHAVTMENILTGLPPDVRAEAAHKHVLEPLTLMVKGCESDDSMNMIGRLIYMQWLRGTLRSRAHINRILRENRHLLEKPIHKPVFIIGLPRTGTTLLHSLMAQDPQFKAHMAFEMMYPSPNVDEYYKRDPQYKRVNLEMEFHNLLTNGEMDKVHKLKADSYEECFLLLDRVFLNYVSILRLRSMHELCEWFYTRDDADMMERYRYYRALLQIIGHKAGKAHLLKAHIHLLGLEALQAVFPDACLIFTYRPLRTLIPSFCSLIETTSNYWGGPPDSDYVKRVLRLLGTLANRATEFIEKHDQLPAEQHPVFELHYDELTKDPIAAVRRIYDHFGYTMTDEAERRMRKFLVENPKDKHGRHRYSLQEYKVTDDDLHKYFGPYLRHFATKSDKLI